MNTQPLSDDDSSDGEVVAGLLLRALVALLISVLAASLGYVVWSLPASAAGLLQPVMEQLPASGVSNPVTAVLLNFRGYDTLLEMFVLLQALLGVRALGGTTLQQESAPGPVLDMFVRLLVPLLILVAGYLLWVGAHAPGGAFQAGAVLGAAGVLLLLAGWRPDNALPELTFRLLLIMGPAAFVILALITLLIYHHLLEFPPAHAGTLILLLETAATVSIGATLMALFIGGGIPQKEHK